ncbi:preprotein translocase subunit SecY [Sphingobacteriales bacterium UPWRP_1]|nr:preprotein translocase subunit SecY [Sphingobacteriales bacterium TSM_CSS]PSJ76828.1 preprotein translocase subunit SecY [Sphingobacteriales bacterium UPWRP_1]
MRNLLTTIRNILKIEDLRQRLFLTVALVFIYRLGSYVVLPGVDPNGLSDLANSGSSGLLGLVNIFVGGSFGRASIFALGIMPYISASIAMQLLTLAIPYFQKLQKEGESGRRKINQTTRILTIAVTAFQALGYVTFLHSIASSAIVIGSFLFTISTVVVLTAGTVFCMWLGEKITDKGIGNGISLLIAVGIMARLPFALAAELEAKLAAGSGGGLVFFVIEMAFLVAIVFGTIMLVQGTRRIPVQYAKRIVGNRQYGGVRQFIPLKINAAGVMPIIFAQALMFIPSFVATFFPDSAFMQGLQRGNFYHSFWYNFIFFFMIILFTYFYTALVINPSQMADDMKRNNGFIPGVKPGRKTAEFIDDVLSKITLPGSIFLGIIAILPSFATVAGINSQFANFFGGTSLLILVGVMLDTLQQVESHLLMRHYDGLLKGNARIKGRQAVGVYQQ